MVEVEHDRGKRRRRNCTSLLGNGVPFWLKGKAQDPKDAEHCRSRSLPSQPELQATSSPRMLYALLLPLLATWACAISPHLPPAAIDATAAAIGPAYYVEQPLV